MNIRLGKYRPYKGKEYEVLGLANHSETLEPMVVYKALYGEGETVPVDLIGIDGIGYSINMINIGFDCHVVDNAQRYKNIRGVSGNLSYILGVIRQFFRPFGEDFRVFILVLPSPPV